MSIGDQLRQAREAQAISLDMAAQATHIRLRYLEALEANQFDVLSSSAQVRGFLRAYGDYLKLNSNELIQALEGDWKTTQTSTAPSPASNDVGQGVVSSSAIFQEIGQILRSQRELMGLSLGDIERHTHLRMHYVQALEEGDISHLPSPVQGRGMLSNYASFLGLNTEEVLLRFADGLQASLYDRQAARHTGQTKPRQDERSKVPTRPSQIRRLFSMDLFVGGLLLIFLLGFTIWGALRVSALRSNQEASPTAPPVSGLLLSTQGDIISATMTIAPTSEGSIVSTPVVEISVDPGATQAVQAETPVAVEPTPYFGNAPVQVNIVSIQQAWMRVTVDGEVVFEDRTMPGSAYTYAGNEQVILRTGNGGGLQVYFNQQDLGLLGAFGEVVERVFTIQGILTATPGVLPTSTPAPTGSPTPSSTPTATGAAAISSATPFP